MRCAMCGYEFDEKSLVCHNACPLGSHCSVVCCPQCGYSTVDPQRSSVVRWVDRLFHRAAPTPSAAGPLPLLGLRPGQAARVVDLGDGPPDQMLHLSHFGLLPGAPITLRQTRPTPIVRVGETDLALDTRVAASIQVEVVS